MGIERFFSAINRNFDVVDEIMLGKKIDCKAFLIDFNSIIHFTSSKLLNEMNKKEVDIDLVKIEEIEDKIILEVKNYLDDLLSKVNTKLVYIALDGVPTLAKMLEQKKRRFIGDLIDQLVSKYALPYNFSKSLISPGTKFMKKVIEYLNKEDFGVETIISDTNDTGEGEFKILDYIRKNKIDDFVIYSPDADLIVLSMILWTENSNSKIKILRFDSNTEVLNIIHINSLINYFVFYQEERIKFKLDNIKYIRDLCLIFTIFGNDFLPKIEEINVNMDLYLLFDLYLMNLVDNGYILNDEILIIPKALHNYFSLLNKYSPLLERRNSLLYKYQNFNYAFMVNLYLDAQSKKANDYYIFYLDFIDNFDFSNHYGKLQYYLSSNNEIKNLLDNYTLKNNFNQNYIEKKLHYQKMIPTEYKSTDKKHLIRMKDLSLRDRELYLINNKLDKYYYLFNPINKTIVREETKEMVNEYLKGLSWLVNYYYKSINDEFWFYKYHQSPSIKNLLNYFNHEIVNFKFKNAYLDISPIEQVIYITPIRLGTLESFLGTIDFSNESQKNKVRKFIEGNPNLFYSLDEIYLTLETGNLKENLMDCSKATFISKCHYYILDNIQPITQFKIL